MTFMVMQKLVELKNWIMKSGSLNPKKFTGLLVLFICLVGISDVHAQTGKISGVITDAETGQTLIGANVKVKGTDLGAATNVEGEYMILRVPPGEHTLIVSYVGYHQKTIEGVEVNIGLRAQVDIEMTPKSYEAPELVVQADNPEIKKDVTSSRQISSRKELQSTPGMDQALQSLTLKSGVVSGQSPPVVNLEEGQQLQVRDESLKNLHIRGGRGGEVLYMVDGMPITHPIYGGRSVMDLDVNSVSQMELLTGAFSAEYGQAQSGVVNITTRSGGESYKGGVEYKSDAVDVLGRTNNAHYTSMHLGGPVPEPFFDLPGRLSFFTSANVNMTNTDFNNQRDRESFEIFGNDLISKKQDNTLGLTAKVDWRFEIPIKLTFNYQGSWKEWSNYEWRWIRNPNNTANYTRNNQNFGFKFTHTLSSSTFYTLTASRLAVDYNASLRGQTPTDFWSFYPDSTSYANNNPLDYSQWKDGNRTGDPYRVESSLIAPRPDPMTGFYTDDGAQAIWRDDYTETYTVKGDLTSQVFDIYMLKTGFEFQYHDLQYIDIQDGAYKLSNYGQQQFGVQDGESLPKPPGPFPEMGQNRWVFDVKPKMGSAYLQNVIELETLIINAGIRLDAFLPGETVFDEEYKRTWERATGLEADWERLRYTLSPRLGISYPINERTKVFFSYGHFNQLPELQFYYRDPYTGGLTGNPHLDYEQTILFEFGFERQLFDYWLIDVKSYAKDISKQVGTTQLKAALGLPVALYDNRGYSRTRGIEFNVSRKRAEHLSMNVKYTLQWATGHSSSAFEDYQRSITDFPNPIRERRLSYDVRHQVVFQSTLSSPKGKPVSVLGWQIPFDNWNLNILSRFSSGYPYTPGTNDPAELQELENTKTGPATYSTDLKFQKMFDLNGPIDLTLFLDIYNLFDTRNIQIAYGFNNWDGEPYELGDTFQDTDRGYNYYDIYVNMDPRRYSPGIRTRFGISLSF